MLPHQFVFAGAVGALAPVTDADGSLGLCNVLPGTAPDGTPWAQLAYDAGARLNRWEFRWDRIEPQPDTWSFASDDAAVKASEQYGLDMEGILIATPAWAAAAGQKPGNGVPRGLYRSPSDPRNLWADYVRQMANHYPEIQYWEVWNEPDLQFFWMGTAKDYFRLLKVTYLVVKQVNPSAQVLMAGMVSPDLSFVGQVLSLDRSDPGFASHNGYFDIAAWHAYGPARTLLRNVVRLRELLQEEGRTNVPIWVTEDGFPASNPQGEPRQAAYILQSIAYAFAVGAQKVFVYRASDDTTGKRWGILSASGELRMAYAAFQVAAHYLAGREAVTYAPTPSLQRFSFDEQNQRVTLLWNRGQTDVRIHLPAARRQATVVDWLAGVNQVNARSGSYQLVVPGARYNQGIDAANSVVGGPPLLVLENNAPPDNLSAVSYLPPVPGSQRRLVLMNRGDSPVMTEVAAATDRQSREVVAVPPHALRSVDLDLLAGHLYTGMYVLSSTGSVGAEATSDRATVEGSVPSSSWLLASVPSALTLGNVSATPVTVTVTGFGEEGKVRTRTVLTVGPWLTATWTPPAGLQGQRMALTVRASGPVTVSGPGAAPLAQPQTTWYAVRPHAPRLVVFNPDTQATAQIDAKFVGAPNVLGQQVRIPPHHFFPLAMHGAKALIMSATHAVAVAYPGRQAVAPPVGQPSTRTALTVAGPATAVALFNPSQQAAHVTLSVLSGGEPRQRNMVLGPLHVAALQIRRAGSSPRGVVSSSDVAIVAAPSR